MINDFFSRGAALTLPAEAVDDPAEAVDDDFLVGDGEEEGPPSPHPVEDEFSGEEGSSSEIMCMKKKCPGHGKNFIHSDWIKHTG